jgi:hypothetical protein
MLENHRKVVTWSIPNLLWADIPKTDIENKKRNEYPTEFFRKFNHTKIVEYVKTVQAL